MKSLSRQSKILLVTTALLLAFIWGHSLADKATSSQESARILQLLTPFLELFLGKGNVSEHVVRKLAHFIEFTALGADLLLLFRSLGQKHPVLLSLGCGWLAGFLDESLQMFSDRGDKIIDVWLDVAGCFFGVFLVLFVRFLLFRYRQTKG